MNDFYLLNPADPSERLSKMINAAVSGKRIDLIDNIMELNKLEGRLLIPVDLNCAGYNLKIMNMITELYEKGADLSMLNCAILISGKGEFYTKATSQNFIFLLNQLGAGFIGHPVIEATGELKNLLTWQKAMNIPLEDICLELSRRLGERLKNFKQIKSDCPNVTVLHASNKNTSNTLNLWIIVKKYLSSFNIEEYHVSNETIKDCRGCSFKTCSHYSQSNSCFYGGPVVEEIFPAIEKSNALIFLSPNYNDAISANLSAVINRLTALYRKINFYDKSIFSIIVSGNSGSDCVGRQLIGALNINKGFYLPSKFCLTETANDPGTVRKIPNIEDKALDFAGRIIKTLKA